MDDRMSLINDIFGLKEQLIIFMREWLTCTCSGCIHDFMTGYATKCYIVLWMTKKIDWSERVVLWRKLMIDYLWKDWLNQLTEWRITDYSTAFQMTSSSFVILVDYMSVLFYFFYSETVGCISNLSCFSTPPLKKKGHNEKIPEKWLNWIIPCWCGRDFYWVPFISKSWYKTNQIS